MDSQSFFQKPHPTRAWAPKRNASGYFIDRAHRIKTRVSISSQGLRDSEIPLERDPRKLRILLLGGSAVAGFEVEKNQCVDTVLEALLSKHLEAEVINAGVPGYDLTQSHLYLKEEGHLFKPDLVIYFSVSQRAAEPAKSKNLWISRNFFLQRVHQTFYKYSYIYRGTFSFALKKLDRVVLKDRSSTLGPDEKITRSLFESMAKLTREFGSDFALFEFSNGSPVYLPESSLRKIAADLKIDLIKTHEKFSQAKEGTYYFSPEGYWNPTGHLKAAEILFSYLTHEGWELMREKVQR
ncbi:MAG: SGNH/GDSL hydrolase family protein [Candidatus Omnitrophica bacterium]|nr:SGNH/GDSL hydrolase family protein [Candidatus Omnitrophota bacterium]